MYPIKGSMNARNTTLRRAIKIAVPLMTILVAVSIAGCSWFSSAKAPAPKPVVQAAAPKPITCPLCGLPADPALLARRPVAVKIENDPAARPQSGLDKACVVYEEQCEGGVTRFAAVYLDREASSVGPVRSARPADIEIAFPYNALLCHCGGGAPILAIIRASGIADLDEQNHAAAYYRSRDRRAPHNLYSTTAALRQAGNAAYAHQGQAAPAFKFLTDAEQAKMESERSAEISRDAANQANPKPGFQPSMAPVSNLHLPYEPICVVDYKYDSSSGRFMRFVSGVPQVDKTTGGQLAADTVIVQYVNSTPSGLVDVEGADTPNLGLIGSGKAQVFVRGRMIDATWKKASRTDYTTYTDSAGKQIPVKPGTTWVELLPSSWQATFN